MSVQIAKTSNSNANRRANLSLGAAKNPKSKDSSDSDSRRLSLDGKVDKKTEKNEDSLDKSKASVNPENESGAKLNEKPEKVEKDKSGNKEEKKDEVSKKEKEQNGSDMHKETKSNGHNKDDGKSKRVESKRNESRDGPRDKKPGEEKADLPAEKTEEKKDDKQKSDGNDIKTAEIEQSAKKIEKDRKSMGAEKLQKPSATPKKEGHSIIEATQQNPGKESRKSTPTPVKKSKNEQSTPDKKKNAPAANCEDMESLTIESDTEDNSPTKATKILKLKQSIIQQAETSPTSKYSIEITSPSAHIERPYTTSLRGISGRKSFRPLQESSFQYTYRDSYRKIRTEFDNTSASLNVTVGSEIPNETSSSFSFFGRGRKRERTSPKNNQDFESNDREVSPKSPKRARLDLSGLFGIVSSPVTMLRARLSRARIHSTSTPNKMAAKENEEGVENVSVIETEEAIEVDADGDIEINEETKSDSGIAKEAKELQSDVEIADDESVKGNQEGIIADANNKRRMCNVM